MNMRTILFAAILLSSLGSAWGQDVQALKAKYLSDITVSEEIKAGIRSGVVVPGMCPFQAFAAAGLPGQYMVVADKKKWGSEVPPPTIISAQCEHPDDSTFALLFRNSTQFKSATPIVFRVKFANGKAVSIDQKPLIDEKAF